jgi:hypothetical protein
MSDTTPRISKRFQIEVIEDRVLSETIMRIEVDAETKHRRFIREQVERVVPVSYMVYFPGGHSIWCETKNDLARLGLVESENFEIDLDTGLPVQPPKQVDLKARVERATRNTRHRG